MARAGAEGCLGVDGIAFFVVEPRLQLLQSLVGHSTQQAQRVLLWYSLLGAHITKHVQLVLIFSTHESSYQFALRKQERFLVLGQLA